MAIKATVVKSHLSVADMDRHHYADYELTWAMHPSETPRRFMVRLIAFALNAHEDLQMGKGLCVDDEPELWIKDLSDNIELWIDLGQLDEKWLRKASGRANQVQLYCYGGGAVGPWWKTIESKLSRFDNLSVWQIDEADADAAAQLFERGMRLSASIDQGSLCLSNETDTVWLTPTRLK
ncbi:YaeQ family protein [Paraferrimonas sedimenticola]|uniref:YaeQ protein n=1 Tax=Paraferrimonas sedimenticola TaxID=375674 RepID=A0AA37RUR2_9GAMM|nr:YaeQ family protein [Paraferrimonas sedimenticola]GLP95192.1 hypothetical protein GCM10007895_04980 [Paraferrimonas sedimenticola]